jgi:ribonuclease G
MSHHKDKQARIPCCRYYLLRCELEMKYLVQVEDIEVRVAKVSQGRLIDLDIERDNRLLGNIYKGRIANVLPGMDAAFIDLGLMRNALIYVGDLHASEGSESPAQGASIGQRVKVNDWLMVQIARPPVGSKGARVTQKLSLPGRYVVLMTGSDSVGVSRRIESNEERERLRRIADRVRPLDHGIIVRTEAEGASEADLTRDVGNLHRQFEQIVQRAGALDRPGLVHRELGLLGRLARDHLNQDVEQIVFDSSDEYSAFCDLVSIIAPQYSERISLHSSTPSLFESAGINDQIAMTMERVVPLASGGYLSIDEAEALTAIDVNTGKFVGKKRLADTVLKTNSEAVDEVARQLRLRNIGGVIVIDFIDMESTRDRIKVMNALEAALKSDHTRTRIVQLSPLGLVEMTRRREGESLRQLLFNPCPYCDGEGVIKSPTTVAIDARRHLREVGLRDLHQSRSDTTVKAKRSYRLTLHPKAALALLEGATEALPPLESSISASIHVRAAANMHPEKFSVRSAKSDDLDREINQWQPGTRVTLSRDQTTSLHLMPGYVLVNEMLVSLSTVDDEPSAQQQRRPAVIEIVETGRWFASARVLVWQEAT